MGLILLRYGELALKGGNRPVFLRKLRRNVRACLRASGLEGQVESAGSRLFVHTGQVEQAIAPLQRVFGVVSLSPVVETPRDLEAMAQEAVRQAVAAGLGPSRSFRIAARRADKHFPYTSPEIGRALGAAVCQATNARVDLSDSADVSIGVEVMHDRVLLYGQVYPGPGGFPLGSAGRAVALMSGGIDSPVAAWMMMKRGCSIIPLHFRHNDVEAGKALDNCRLLEQWSYGFRLRPIIMEQAEVFGPTYQRLRALGEERWTCVMCKRTLITKAIEVAAEHHALAVVTGESLGQVASQTLENLGVIGYGQTLPILRPLIGLDKIEVMDLARRLGTYDISVREAEGCAYLPRHPLTRGNIAALQRLLAQLEQPVRGGAEVEP
ncbi:MAG TPA: tRNA uracil 4-sulfurtransferase ThiI [Anaerolineae bacterium]|nr:tRNA uracil 4-sulfurtransferase ThiI [Anaerolineae bacterium]HPL28327.1 tRNA uracil 4-sulfurtransferase ThiI [Anaerolineae bacterium]